MHDQQIHSLSRAQTESIKSNDNNKTKFENKNYSENIPKRSEPNREDGITDAFKFNNLVSSIFGALDFGQPEEKEEDHSMDEYIEKSVDFSKSKNIKQKDIYSSQSNFEDKEVEKSLPTSQNKSKTIPKNKIIEPEIEHAELDDDFFEMFKKPKVTKQNEEVKIEEESKADPILPPKPKNSEFLNTEPIKFSLDVIDPDLEIDNWNEDLDINIDSDVKSESDPNVKSEPDQIPSSVNDQQIEDPIEVQVEPVSVQKSGKNLLLLLFI